MESNPVARLVDWIVSVGTTKGARRIRFCLLGERLLVLLEHAGIPGPRLEMQPPFKLRFAIMNELAVRAGTFVDGPDGEYAQALPDGRRIRTVVRFRVDGDLAQLELPATAIN